MVTHTLSRQTIVFDLDGTLVDTAADLIDTLNQVLVAEGLPTVADKAIRHRVGEGMRVMIDQAARYHNVTLTDSKIDDLSDKFLAIYTRNCTENSIPFPGVTETLDTLRNRGAHLAVCTSKQGELARKVIKSLALSEYFSAIVCGDQVPNKKPHGDHFATAVTKAGGSIRRALMVGDSSSDVATARACNAKVILVDFGYSSIPPRDMGADAVVSDFSDIPAVATRLISSAWN